MNTARVNQIARVFADEFPNRIDAAASAERIATLCDAANDPKGAIEMRAVAVKLRAAS